MPLRPPSCHTSCFGAWNVLLSACEASLVYFLILSCYFTVLFNFIWFDQVITCPGYIPISVPGQPSSPRRGPPSPHLWSGRYVCLRAWTSLLTHASAMSAWGSSLPLVRWPPLERWPCQDHTLITAPCPWAGSQVDPRRGLFRAGSRPLQGAPLGLALCGGAVSNRAEWPGRDQAEQGPLLQSVLVLSSGHAGPGARVAQVWGGRRGGHLQAASS